MTYKFLIKTYYLFIPFVVILHKLKNNIVSSKDNY